MRIEIFSHVEDYTPQRPFGKAFCGKSKKTTALRRHGAKKVGYFLKMHQNIRLRLSTVKKSMAQRTFSYKQYRAADLTIFLLILCVLETTIAVLAKQWADTLYVISLVYVVAVLVMMRWGGWAALHCVAAAAVQCLVNGADAAQWVAYIAGNCCALLALVLLRIVGKEKVRKSALWTLAYIAVVFAAVCLGRAAVLSVFKSQDFWDLAAVCFSTDALSAVITAVIVLIARTQNGLFEDQKQYLLRTEQQRREELKNKPQD